MAQNRSSTYPKQQTAAMPPSHPHTVGAVVSLLTADDDEDNDICPVCDGECTCDSRLRQPLPARPGSSRGETAPNVASTSASSHSPLPALGPASQPLKIRLPASLLGKRRVSEIASKRIKSIADATFAAASDGDALAPLSVPQPSSSHSSQESSMPKRRGRPPKTSAAPKGIANLHADNTLPIQSISLVPSAPPRSHKRKNTLPVKPGKTKTPSGAARPPAKSNGKGTSVKKAAAQTKKRQLVLSESSDLSDVDPAYDFNDQDDARSDQFPTFVSASALSASSDSDSDIASLSSFDTDSSMEAEEENFILTEEQRLLNKARVRRELLGDEGGHKRRDHQNKWVIRTRKKSVGLSDVEMGGDSDEATEDEEEDGEAEDEADEEDADEDDVAGVGYEGVATGWSEDEESSFDADLFFANLSDSTGDDASAASGDEGDNQCDGSDLDAMSLAEAAAAGLIPHLSQDLENLPFEVTEGWDGQIVFTNGLQEGQGILDIHFEVNAAQLVVESSASASQDSDIEMTTDEGEGGEYEEGDDFDLQESDGETTEEELVGEDGLPTARAMRLFRLPSSVSAINPMSTMSPAASPSPRDRKRADSESHRESPKPADILAGRVYWDESDDEDSTRRPRSITVSSRGGPVMGHFDPGDESPQKRVIIDGSIKDVPSPFPRSRRGRSVSRLGPIGGMDHVFRARAASRPSSLSEDNASSGFQVPSSEDIPTSPEQPPAEPIDLDDVLDASFLDSDSLHDPQVLSSTESESDTRRHLKNLSRWDLISVGAFRQTRETASGALSDSPSASWAADTPRAIPSDRHAFGTMMKSSPLSTMLWHNKAANSKQRAHARRMSVVISPVILPVRDGDRTPTDVPPEQRLPPPPQNEYPHKTRKELRREKKLRRRETGPVHLQHQHHQQHHLRNHHPNKKSRASSSMQRTNFFSPTSSVPPLNL